MWEKSLFTAGSAQLHSRDCTSCDNVAPFRDQEADVYITVDGGTFCCAGTKHSLLSGEILGIWPTSLTTYCTALTGSVEIASTWSFCIRSCFSGTTPADILKLSNETTLFFMSPQHTRARAYACCREYRPLKLFANIDIHPSPHHLCTICASWGAA